MHGRRPEIPVQSAEPLLHFLKKALLRDFRTVAGIPFVQAHHQGRGRSVFQDHAEARDRRAEGCHVRSGRLNDASPAKKDLVAVGASAEPAKPKVRLRKAPPE